MSFASKAWSSRHDPWAMAELVFIRHSPETERFSRAPGQSGSASVTAMEFGPAVLGSETKRQPAARQPCSTAAVQFERLPKRDAW